MTTLLCTPVTSTEPSLPCGKPAEIHGVATLARIARIACIGRATRLAGSIVRDVPSPALMPWAARLLFGPMTGEA
jgi:alkylated DNA nucleotide flippase Atl1